MRLDRLASDLQRWILPLAGLIQERLAALGPDSELGVTWSSLQDASLHDISEEDWAESIVCAQAGLRWMGIEDGDGLDSLYRYARANRLGLVLRPSFHSGKIDSFVRNIREYLSQEASVAGLASLKGKLGDRSFIHFYEELIGQSSAGRKRASGIYYTPGPVIDAMVRMVDESLEKRFGLEDGLASTLRWKEHLAGERHDLDASLLEKHLVQVFDPCTGTGGFLLSVIELIHSRLLKKWERRPIEEVRKEWNSYVNQHLIDRLHGCELHLAPYVLCHINILNKLLTTGCSLDTLKPLGVFNANSLDDHSRVEEGRSSGGMWRRLKETPHFIVIGNPPYSKFSHNLSKEHKRHIEAFRYVAGERIREKAALAHEVNLNDDYVKFFGLMVGLLTMPSAICCYITNNRYLDSRSLRGLRAKLVDSFTALDIVDLGGQGSESDGIDENLFKIVQGTCIGLFCRAHGAPLRIRYTKIKGTRAIKTKRIGDSSSLVFADLQPTRPYFHFNRNSGVEAAEFSKWPTLADIFPVNSGGIISARDALAISRDPVQLQKNLREFSTLAPGDTGLQSRLGYRLKKKWDVDKCKRLIEARESLEEKIQPIHYRPFDSRWIYYDEALIDTPSGPICRSIYGNENLVLLSPRVKTTAHFSHILVSNVPAESKCCSHDRATQMFPLFLYRGKERISNGSSFLLRLQRECGRELEDEALVFYIYAILHSVEYRNRYGSLLRDCFPRIPLPGGPELGTALIELGRRLVRLHVDWSAPSVRSGLSDCLLEKREYDPARECIWTNASKSHAIHGVSNAVWEYRIGGYRVCDKWLKSRMGQPLSRSELAFFCWLLEAIAETLQISSSIDERIQHHGGWPRAFVSI
jgi:predicted helicase